MSWGSLIIEVSTKKISIDFRNFAQMTRDQILPKDLAMKCHAENEIVEEVPSANSTEMIGLMSILQHLSNVCSTEKPVKRSTHVCDSEGFWGEY